MLFITRDSFVRNMLVRRKYYLAGFIIHLASYLTAMYAKRGNFDFQKGDLILMAIIMSVSFLFSILLEKYRYNKSGASVNSSFKSYFYSFLLSLGVISLLITLFFKENSSRYIVFGSLVVSFTLESAILLFNKDFRIRTVLQNKFKFSIINFITEFLIFVLSVTLFLKFSNKI